jgi:hypothetical protein
LGNAWRRGPQIWKSLASMRKGLAGGFTPSSARRARPRDPTGC